MFHVPGFIDGRKFSFHENDARLKFGSGVIHLDQLKFFCYR